MQDAGVDVLAGHLEGQARPDGVQRVGERHGRHAGARPRHELARVVPGAQERRQRRAVQLESRKLRGSVREDSHHLRSIAFVQSKEPLLSHDVSKAREHTQMLVMLVMRLQQDFYSVKRGHRCLGAHTSHSSC